MGGVTYLSFEQALRFHQQIMGRTSKSSAPLRDEGLLRSALARPIAVALYDSADIIQQAAVLIEGIARNHAFVDGNKRAAAICGDVFLRLNGWHIARVAPDSVVFGQRVKELVEQGGDGFAPFLDWLTQIVEPR